MRVENVSKKFSISLKRAMVYGLSEIFHAALLPGKHGARENEERPSCEEMQLRATEFWALKDVSFDLRRGECLGLIGNNGAGKSTLLSILSGIYSPSVGQVEVHGRLQALIALGAGFHPTLSGRENIFIYGLVLGLKDEEIRGKLDEIIEFSELGEFIDMPVKNYSSGMYVRLGFAVAAHMNPDILLIDEVLAVGDISFRRKCMEKVNELVSGDRAVIVVSHSLYQIESLCNRVLWMEKGAIREHGSARDIVKAYRDEDIRKSMKEHDVKPVLAHSDLLTIHRVHVTNEKQVPISELGYSEPFTVRIHYTANQVIKRPMFNLRFDTRGVGVFECSMIVDGEAPAQLYGDGIIDCHIEQPNLLPNQYEVSLFVRNQQGTADLIDSQRVGQFTITSGGLMEKVPSSGPYAIGHLMHGQITYQKYRWDVCTTPSN